MNNNEELKKEIALYFYNLIEQIVDLKFYIEVQKEFQKNIHLGGKYHELYNVSPNFFHCFAGPTIPFTVIQASRIYDKENSFGIKKMINLVIQNKNLFFVNDMVTYYSDEGLEEYSFSEFIDLIELEFEKLETEIKKLKTWRNKYIAHNDKKYFGKIDELQKDTNMLIGDIEKLNDLALHICKTLVALCFKCKVEPFYSEDMTKDMNNLFELALFGLKHKEENK